MSSNSLHIIRPSEGRISKADIKVVEEEAGESGALNLPDEAVTAIAKCGSTLELYTPPGGFSAVPFLEKSLGLFDRRAGDDDGDVSMDESGELGLIGIRRLRDQICADIPVSAAQCEAGWVEICAFVDERMKVCWRPSAKMKVNVWKRMVEGALLQGIDLEKQFLVGDLWKAVLDDDESEPFPKGLLEAVVRRLCVLDERPVLADEIKCEFEGWELMRLGGSG
jgi:sister chromatid cohesion protein DCC1